ncbi:uncharacterized protein [Neodiprion pinetum]|uniref:uncharacterized protein n=1 Tax=Neodiprion pinetum TaxID=441929 RepID=UPI001EE0BF0B|nr:uncharacterized protein LOC124218790 [Neodiprion pinetum]
MHAGNNGCSYAGCDDYIEEDEFDNNDEYIALNYNDFHDHRNKSCLSPPLDESESENYDFDEQHCEGQGNYEQYFIPDSSGKSVAAGQHSCLKLKDNYCYLDRNAYDTRVMRNLASTEDYEHPRGSYSPRFIQAALERTKSSSFWGDGLSKKVIINITKADVLLW